MINIIFSSLHPTLQYLLYFYTYSQESRLLEIGRFFNKNKTRSSFWKYSI